MRGTAELLLDTIVQLLCYTRTKIGAERLPATYFRLMLMDPAVSSHSATTPAMLMIDPAEDTSHAEPKNVPCEDHDDVSK